MRPLRSRRVPRSSATRLPACVARLEAFPALRWPVSRMGGPEFQCPWSPVPTPQLSLVDVLCTTADWPRVRYAVRHMRLRPDLAGFLTTRDGECRVEWRW